MFLPRILLLPWILALSLAGCDGERAPTPPLEVVDVVAGAGEVAPAVVDRVRDVVARELPDLQATFDGQPLQRFFVHVHEARDAMPDALLAGLHEDAPGFAILGRHQIHIVWGEIRRTGARLDGVVRHELVHELLDQYCAPDGRFVPRWFHEGLAQLLAGDTYLGAREDDLFWRVGSGSLFGFQQLHDHFPESTVHLRTAYAQSYSFVAWLERSYGLATLLRCARDADGLTSFMRALVAQTGRSSLQLEDRWRDYLVNGSGARWRILFDNWFSLLLVAALPVLVLALIRRLSKEARTGRLLAARERAARAAAERAAAERAAAAEDDDGGDDAWAPPIPDDGDRDRSG